MKEAFEKMTGMPDAWTNPALMGSRNAFIQGWEAALAQPTSGDYALGYVEGFNDACKPAQQEPVGYFGVNDYGRWEENENEQGQPLYISPPAQPAPQRKPVAWSSYEYDGIHHKPVAWMDSDGNVSDNNDHKCFPIPLYTITHPTPPERTWVGLTDDEIYDAAYAAYCRGENSRELFRIMWNSRLTCSIGWDRDELKSFARNIAAIYIHPWEKN